MSKEENVETKKCPINGKECTSACAWYDEQGYQCAVLEYLRGLYGRIEDMTYTMQNAWAEKMSRK